jgi:uncharacterized protein (DUF305 family)
MRGSRCGWLLAALFIPLLPAACSQATSASPGNAQPGSATLDELEAIYRARQDSARMRFTELEVRFMNGMIAHHAQAIVMSRLAPTHGANGQIQTLAARIINAQRDEIALMQQWLRDREQPVPEVHITEQDVVVHGADHSAHAPGMLTPAQLDELRRARGVEFDRLYLTYMIMHHQGAVTMVHDLFNAGGGQDEAAFKLASDVQADQTSEIRRMELMLKALPARDGV